MVITRRPRRVSSLASATVERRLARVLPPDYGDDPCRRHSSFALARSSAVLTLKNRSSGSPKRRTSDRGRIPMVMRGWKPTARRSPASRLASMAPGRPGHRRRRAARGRAGRRSRRAWRRGPRAPGQRLDQRGEARTACPRRRRPRGPALRPPRCRMPPSAPAPGRTSVTTRRSGRQRRRSGRSQRATAARRAPPSCASTSRSRIRSPPTVSSPFGRRSNRSPHRPPAARWRRLVSTPPARALEHHVEPDVDAEEVLVHRLVGRGRADDADGGPVTADEADEVVPHLPPDGVAAPVRERGAHAERERRA